MSFTLCTSGAIVNKAGAKASTTATTSNAILSDFSDEAESYICMRSRFDWLKNYTSVKTNFKPVLADAVSSIAAMKVVNYDMSKFSTRLEAQTVLDVLRDNAEQILQDLEKKEIQEVMI